MLSFENDFQKQHSNDVEAVNEQFYKEVSVQTEMKWDFYVFQFSQNIKKDEQLNLLRDANLQLRSQVFELNQDIVDLLEIVENQKNRRMVSEFSKLSISKLSISIWKLDHWFSGGLKRRDKW